MDQFTNTEILDSNSNLEQTPSLRLKSRVKKFFKNFKKNQKRIRRRKIESYSQTPEVKSETQLVEDVVRDPSYIPKFQQEADRSIRLISSSVEPIAEINFPTEVDVASLKLDAVRLGGSSEVVLTTIEGQTVVIKEARLNRDGTRNTGQMYEEFIADRIYSELGFSTPISKLYENGRYRFVTFVPGKDLGTLERNSSEMLYVKQELRKGFVLDCFLGNWDVAGSGWDNVRLGIDGNVYRIDNGGSLRYRARGEKKGTRFSGKIVEFETLPESERIYEGITNLEIYEQGLHIINNFERILELIRFIGINSPDINHEELIAILIERFNYLKLKLEMIRESDPLVKEKYSS